MRLFTRGRRPLTVASLLLLCEAAAHTAGSLAPLPDDPAILNLATTMRETRLPMGFGMEPSAFEINRSLAFAMTVLLVLMGAAGLLLPETAPDNRRVYLATVRLLLVANLALLALWITYRIPPPLTFQLVLTPLLLFALRGGPSAAPGPDGARGSW